MNPKEEHLPLSTGSLFRNKKQKVVETKQLQIRGHLLQWEDTAIQISNVSLISIEKYQAAQFPLWAGAAVLFGALILSNHTFIGLALIAVGVLCLYLWFNEREKTKDYKYLNISLNSGSVFSLLFAEEWFLLEVLNVFANIFEDGAINPNTNISIDIQNCTVDNQSTLIGSLSATDK